MLVERWISLTCGCLGEVKRLEAVELAEDATSATAMAVFFVVLLVLCRCVGKIV